MNKYAFRSQQEKTALLDLLKQAPLLLKPTFISFAAGISDMQVGTQNPAVEDSLSSLREMLHNYLREVHLEADQSAIQFVEHVIEKMRPAVSQTVKGNEGIWDRLQDTPWVNKSIGPEPEAGIGDQPFSLEDTTQMGESWSERMPEIPMEPPPKPEVLTQNEKLSPKAPAPLWRKKPPMSTGAAAKEKTMQKDETFDAIVASILDLADLADEAGMMKASDRLASVLPAMRTVKVAQYEGFQNYWIANGRAFEMAYKQKRSKGKTNPDDFRSPHEVWFEILEEYQKSLLTNQADFISKYAGKNFEQTDKAASQILMTRISSRIEKGSSPGVALYEAIDELAGGQHFRLVGASLFEVLEEIEKEAAAEGKTVISAKAAELTKTAAGWFGKLLRYLGFNYGNPTTSIPKVLSDGVKRKLVNDLSSLHYRAQSQPTPVSELYKSVGQYYDLISEFMDRARFVKRKGIPQLQEPESVAGPDGNIDPSKMAQFVNNIQSALAFIHPDVAERIDKDIYANSEGLKGSAADHLPPTGPADSAAPMTPATTPGGPASAATPPGASPAAPGNPVPAPAAPAPAGNVGETFNKEFTTMPVEKQFALLEKIMPLVSKWYGTPEADAYMAQKGVTPTGTPYKSKKAPAAPATPPPATPAGVPAAAPVAP